MKSIAVAALLGYTSAVKIGSNQDKLFQIMEESELVQTDKILETLPNWDGWHPEMHKFPGTVNEYGNYMDSYNRELPERFQGDAADEGIGPVDKVTQNIIANYAVEGVQGTKAKNPSPTGQFYLTKDKARVVAKEVLCTHFNKCDAAGEEFLNSPGPHDAQNKFDDAWDYFDVNHEGRLDAVGVSTFYRHLCMPLGWLDV